MWAKERARALLKGVVLFSLWQHVATRNSWGRTSAGAGGSIPQPTAPAKEKRAKQSREREREQANASPTEDGSHWGCLVYSDGACHSESKGKPRTGSSVQ